ncbi:MAG: SprT family zinc-dependent metalloprotease [Sphingomonadales bacterium]|jgi:hypothetical protein
MAQTLRVISSPFGPWFVGYQRSTAVDQSHLSINGRKRAITLKVPKTAPIQDVDTAFALREAWIERFIEHLSAPRRRFLRPGTSISFKGESLHLNHDPVLPNGVQFDGESLHIGGHKSTWRDNLERWLRGEARKAYSEAVQGYAQQLGVEPKRIAIRDTKSRWGSCSTSGTLSFSWRAIMAPPPVLHYLAAHEVSHMHHMNHSAAFWTQVGECQSDWALWRYWLQLHGMELMSLRLR